MRFSFRRMIASVVTAGVCSAVMPVGHAALVYQNNFNDGDTTPEVTPGGGVLGLAGTPAPVVENGVLKNVNPGITTSGSNSVAATVEAQGGTGINLGTLSQFTVTFWLKVNNDYSTATSSTAGYRVLGLGPAGATDGPTGTGLLGIQLRPGSTSNGLTFDISSKGNSGTSGGLTPNNPHTTVGTWTFVALTFDGTSTLGNNSTVQSAATGGASQMNGQLYFADDQISSPLTRLPIPMTTGGTSAGTANDGPYDLGNNAVLLLFNRIGSASDRNLDAFMDDIRIYNTVLSASDVAAIRLEAVPEPTACVLMAIGLAGSLAACRVRRTRRSDC